jgi:hypothetical protein
MSGSAATLFESTVVVGAAASGSAGRVDTSRVVLAMGVVGAHDEDRRLATAAASAFTELVAAARAPLTTDQVTAAARRAASQHPGASLWFSALELEADRTWRVFHVGPFRVCRLARGRDIADVLVPHTLAATLADGDERAAQLATVATRAADASLEPADIVVATVQLGPGDALAVLSSPMSLPTSGMVDPDEALTHIRAALPDPRQHLARFVPYALIRRIT